MFDVYKQQCSGPGAMISFEVTDGKAGAFRFLNNLELIGLATSLGGSESIVSHPGSTSHSTMSEEERLSVGVTPGLIRFSVGLEDAGDLIDDISGALEAV
jgi:methionine-gamma-lyase